MLPAESQYFAAEIRRKEHSSQVYEPTDGLALRNIRLYRHRHRYTHTQSNQRLHTLQAHRLGLLHIETSATNNDEKRTHICHFSKDMTKSAKAEMADG